ncbi:hypothetical protein DMUE_5966, partial [Dictyocoela muelleri]
RAFAKIIPNKLQTTLIPIICNQVISESTIHTDEHASYRSLASRGFIYGTVCHKYNFVNRETGVNTQAIESCNNCLKSEIKKRMGVLTVKRDMFLKEFCFIFNH